jgi:hypothetical protein
VFAKLLARDLTLIGVAILAWRLVAPLSQGTGPATDLIGLLLGLLLGACAFLIHEWGHLLGALASRSVVSPPTSLRSRSVFTFDPRDNTRRQLLLMSFGGFAATAAVVWGAYAGLPDEFLASRVTRGAVALLAVLGIVLEIPFLIYTLAFPRPRLRED